MFEALQLPFAEAIISNTTDGIVICDMRLPDAPIIFSNPAFSMMTGYSQEEVLGWNCNFLQNGDNEQPNKALIRAAIRKREPICTLMRNYRRDGSLFWNELRLYPLSDAEGGEHFYASTQRDVTQAVLNEEMLRSGREELEQRVLERTAELVQANALLHQEVAERRRAESALVDTRAILTIAQGMAHLGSWSFDIASKEMRCSDEIFMICGELPQSVVPTMAMAHHYVHPDDRQQSEAEFARCLRERCDYKYEKRILRQDGTVRHIRAWNRTMLDAAGKPVRLIGSWLDITEHREAEQVLRLTQESLRKLGAHQEHIKENERKRIAREIHDELGALLTGIKAYQAVAMDQVSRSGNPPVESLLEANRLADEAIATVRRVITDLRPSVLDELGIWSAIEWVAERITLRAGLLLNLQIDEQIIDNDLDAERSIALFRIVQEALTNVQRHAQASQVSLQIRRVGNALHIDIRDNGIGVSAEQVHQQESWGLLGMRERIGHFGGSLHISGKPGAGTEVSVLMPLSGVTHAA
ncbi:integral membrane sensor signal transduction histidine kinase [Oxalobacteraceae bacterium IMCC9480]|nr:integral membrane sensor signal transduction histidine kinase [Oxalobacteraceae bacterium IMCC9480]NDP58146.1 PAS domain S-box protein [Oxalobacteraceae bacterium]